MTDWNPQVVQIEKIEKHPDADTLDVATVLGDYPVIVKRDEYKPGDLAGYIPIDSIVPDTDQFYFLCPKVYEKYEDEQGQLQQRQFGPRFPVGSVPEKYRIIKAKKIRGIYSQGMLVGIPIQHKDREGNWFGSCRRAPDCNGHIYYDPKGGSLKNGNFYCSESNCNIGQGEVYLQYGFKHILQPGDSIVEALGLKKWEEQEEENLSGLKKTRGTNAEKAPQGWSIPHYDIDGVRKYLACLQEGEEIVLTEKIHGCLKYDTRISYMSGVVKPICQVQVGDVLIGMSETGSPVPSKVLRKFNNGTGDNWLKIDGTRTNAGRGGNKFAISCTDEHRFFSPKTNQFVRAKELKVGDSVQVLRTDYALSPLQEQVLLGIILGDACLRVHSNVSALVEWGHAKEDIEYFDWIVSALGVLDSGCRRPCKSGYGTDMVIGRTVSSNLIKEKFESFIINNRKTVPKWVANGLTPLAIAFWYMDDGSLSHDSNQEDRVCFAVCSFTESEIDILRSGLRKFGINSAYYSSQNYVDGKFHPKLRLNADDAEKLFLLIAPYIPPCMQRKLPVRYRGHSGWLPEANNDYKPAFVEQMITEIKPLGKITSYKYDLETETHNYLANGLVVHNSNAGFSHDGTRLWVKSRNYYKKQDEDDMWHDIALRYDLENKLAQHPGLVFFGEIYGQVKGFRYDTVIAEGHLMTKIRFFDIWNTKTMRYLDYLDRAAVLVELGLDAVPELYQGIWLGKDAMYPYAEGTSTLNPKHIREGWVLNTLKERYEPKLDSRMQVKLVGEGYNLAK